MCLGAWSPGMQVFSSRIRDRIPTPRIGRGRLSHCPLEKSPNPLVPNDIYIAGQPLIFLFLSFDFFLYIYLLCPLLLFNWCVNSRRRGQERNLCLLESLTLCLMPCGLHKACDILHRGGSRQPPLLSPGAPSASVEGNGQLLGPLGAYSVYPPYPLGLS